MRSHDPKFAAFAADLDSREPQTNPLAAKLLRLASDLSVRAAEMCNLETRCREENMTRHADRVAWHCAELLRHVAILHARAAEL